MISTRLALKSFFGEDSIERHSLLDQENKMVLNFLFNFSSSCCFIGLFIFFHTNFILKFWNFFVLVSLLVI